MLWTQQVVDCLHRVERREWNLHHDGAPVAHSAIPQSGQLESKQGTSVFALVRDEARGRIHIVGQGEGLAILVLHSTHQVNGVEVQLHEADNHGETLQLPEV